MLSHSGRKKQKSWTYKEIPFTNIVSLVIIEIIGVIMTFIKFFIWLIHFTKHHLKKLSGSTDWQIDKLANFKNSKISGKFEISRFKIKTSGKKLDKRQYWQVDSRYYILYFFELFPAKI